VAFIRYCWPLACPALPDRTSLSETSVLAAPDSPPSPRHDILEVNNYFISGLVVSSIDKWFMGPVPRFTPRDVGVTGDEDSLPQVLKHARRVLDSPASMAWQLVGALWLGMQIVLLNLRSLIERQAKRSIAPGPKPGRVNPGIGNPLSAIVCSWCWSRHSLCNRKAWPRIGQGG
jgi:hypothetical protein